MNPNQLLLWLSARRQGSWRQFRQAVEEFYLCSGEVEELEDEDFPLYRRLRVDFERLAHTEFFASGCEKGWRVTPPTLASHTFSNRVRAILCGARSQTLYERVISGSNKIVHERIESTVAPDVIRIVADDVSVFLNLGKEVGINFQVAAPLAILSQLPVCDPPSSKRSASEFPHGADWNIQEFDIARLTWGKVDRGDLSALRYGVVRFRISFQRDRYFLRWKGVTFEMPRAVAIYALLRHRRRNVVQYNSESKRMSLPASCRPPRLVERALVLCSGLLPTYDQGELTYSEVPPDVARIATSLLRQSLI